MHRPSATHTSGPAPTHYARHKKGWDANIYIAPDLQRRLRSNLPREKADAESSVAIRFKAACRQKFPEFNVGPIYFKDLTLTELEPPTANQPQAPAPATAARSQQKYCTCPDENCRYCSGDNGRSHADCRVCDLDA